LATTALAIGIGANTGVFSVVDALLLRSLPFDEPDRLALLHQFIPPHDSAKEFHDWRQQSACLADAALFEENDVNLDGVRVVSRAHVAQTSWNFFSVLGTRPVLGRRFAPEDEVDGTGWGLPGRNAVAVIGYGVWQQLFGGDPKALGATIRIDGIPLTVIGVVPRGFDYPGPPRGGSPQWISLPSCALISQQRSLLSSSDTEFGVEEADEMLPDEIIDDENDG
jgi:putative ABC transport system permease protein